MSKKKSPLTIEVPNVSEMYLIEVQYADPDTGKKSRGGLKVVDGIMVFDGDNTDETCKQFFEGVNSYFHRVYGYSFTELAWKMLEKSLEEPVTITEE